MPKKQKALLRSIASIQPVVTSHGIGEKCVIATNEEVGHPITQIAKTILKKGENVASHIHPSMDEHFFFLKGICLVNVEGYEYDCVPNNYLFVPSGCRHGIRVVSDSEMITIGIEIDEGEK